MTLKAKRVVVMTVDRTTITHTEGGSAAAVDCRGGRFPDFVSLLSIDGHAEMGKTKARREPLSLVFAKL